jgi:hypothetical protein
MATFLKGVTDEFPQMDLYKPDYSFLTQVYGTRQGEYDRGFDYVKNIVNSALNDQLTSESNEEFRKQVFKKIQSSLKDISNLDLSNPANISIANSIVDPITQDKELGRDMALTKFYNREIGKYNALKASDDPKKRALANDYSMAYMNYGINELKNAKRGDGSILNAQPKNFVPFEDVTGFLEQRVKDLKLEIVQDKVHGFYKVKETNGVGAGVPFALWAKNALESDGRFNEQLRVMGFVNAENDIRQEMETGKISRDQALQMVAKKLEKPVTEEVKKTEMQSNLSLADVKEKIELFDREYPNGVPALKKTYYDDLMRQKTQLEKTAGNASKDFSDVTKGGYEYIAQNMHNIYKNNALNKIALDWGKNHANVTAKVEIDQDDVAMNLYKIKVDTSLAYAKMNQDKELAFMKMAQDEKIENAKLELEIKKAGAKGELPVSTIIGTSQTTGSIPAVDILSESLATTRNEIFSDAFDPKDGALNIVVGGENSGKFYSVMDKVKRIANNSNEKLTPDELKLLGTLGGHAGVQVYNPNSPKLAQSTIDALSVGIHNKARKIIPVLAAQGSIQDYKQQVYILNNMMGKFDQAISQKEQIEQNYENIAKAILNPDGSVKETYEGNVKVVGYTSNRYPIFDLSKLSEAQKKGLSIRVSPEFNKRTTGTTITRLNTGVTADEWGNIFGAVAAESASDASVFTKFANMNNKARAEMLGNEYEVSSDPVAETVKITVRAKNDKEKEATAPLVVTIPFETIETNPSLARLKKFKQESTMNKTSLGDFNSLFQNPTGTINAKKTIKDTGFDFTATGNYDRYGNYSVSYSTKYKNPETNKWVNSGVAFIPMSGPDDIDQILALDAHIKTQYESYMTALKTINSKKK